VKFQVEYVFLDEPRPRKSHFETVEAPDAEEAKLQLWTSMQLAGDRVSVVKVTEVE